MNERRKIPKQLFTASAIGIFLLILGFTGILKPVRGLIEKSIVIPVKEKIYTWQRAFKKDLKGCELYNEKQLAELKVQIAGLKEENLAQRKLLASPLPKDWKFTLVKVIGSDGEELSVSSGKTEGILEGMVAVFEKTYLGKIAKAGENISYIRQPSSFNEKLSIKVVSKDSNEIVGKGLLVGRGVGKMRLEQILLKEKVQKGDLIMLETLGGTLFVGRISEVYENKGEVFKTALVERLYNPEELKTIFLVSGKI